MKPPTWAASIFNEYASLSLADDGFASRPVQPPPSESLIDNYNMLGAPPAIRT